MIQNLSDDKTAPIESRMFSRFVKGAQKRIEGNNFDARKNVLKYDDVLRQHREIIYKERMNVLKLNNIEEQALNLLNRTITNDAYNFLNVKGRREELDIEALHKHFDGVLFNPESIDIKDLENKDVEEVIDHLMMIANEQIKSKKENLPNEVFNEFLKVVMLRVIDTYWMSHIDTMSELRQGVSLQSYGQQNPLVIYQKEGYRLFEELTANIGRDVTKYILRANIKVNVEREAVVKNTRTNQGDDKPRRRCFS